MRLALVALFLTLPAASSAGAPPRPAAQPAAPGRICSDDMRVRQARPMKAPGAKRLGELPSGSLTLTVVNRVGDCIEPVVVGQGYGSVASETGR